MYGTNFSELGRGGRDSRSKAIQVWKMGRYKNRLWRQLDQIQIINTVIQARILIDQKNNGKRLDPKNSQDKNQDLQANM